MSRISTEQWERKKLYLIRSLFSDALLLSPIPETQELEREPLTQAEATSNRPYSPLPDLIIEKEPNRHDEPEEYYRALERKLVKFYKKIFYGSENLPLLDFEDKEKYFRSSDRVSCSATVISREKLIRTDLLVGCDDQFNTGNSCNLDRDKGSNSFCTEKKSTETEEQSSQESSKETKSTDTSVTAALRNYEFIVSQALVHNEANEEIDEGNNDTEYEDSSTSANGHESSSNSDDGESRSHEIIVSQALLHNAGTEVTDDRDTNNELGNLSISTEDHEVSSVSNDDEPMSNTSCESNVNLSLDAPEIMRRRTTSNVSMGSIKASDVVRHLSAEFTSNISLHNTSAREMEEGSSPKLSGILDTSRTSETARRVQSKRQDTEKEGTRKRILSEISRNQIQVSKKQRTFEKRAAQTSFSSSSEEFNWQDIQRNFFEGNPQIFKLCSCSNHVCC